jgi:hypothetical protein
MMGKNVIARGYIDNPDTGPQAFGDDPRLYLIRPTPLAPSPGLHNLTPTHKPVETIRHAIPPPDLGRLLAGASRVRNIVNQWVGAAAYGESRIDEGDPACFVVALHSEVVVCNGDERVRHHPVPNP